MAGTTKVGYNAYYDHKLAQQLGLANYSGTRADKEFWAHDQTDTEKEILKIKAHEKQLSVVSQNRGHQVGAPGNNLDGEGNPTAQSARSRNNNHCRQLYNKRRKAKKAQQVKQNAQNKAPAAAAATPAKEGQ